MSTFTTTVKAIVAKIPAGSTMTYKQVAIAASNPKAARAVANIMAADYDPLVPCHRVIRSDGGLGGYNRGGVVAKAALLKAEGVVL
jgi:O-6-methylguanine DNA methyltransferase